MTNKTILLAISINHGISKLIEKNLQYHGFNVVLLSPHDEKDKGFKYPSILENLKVKFKKIILKDKQAKVKLQSKLLKKELENKLRDKILDFSLFILAQNYSVDLIKYIKSKTKSGGMINYQWDGMNRYPKIYERLPFFDRAYVFDPTDLDNNEHDLLPSTSFYFDYEQEPVNEEYDFYFLGSHIENRAEKIKMFANFMATKNAKINFKILGKDKESLAKIYPSNVTIITRKDVRSYEENLIASRKSKVLVDFVDSVHKGLSLRTFEALGYDKKLITTNKEIKKYDFYHPDNIFILDNNLDELQDFLDKPYNKLDPMIKEKYSFGNWINYILDIKPHQKIMLPKE